VRSPVAVIGNTAQMLNALAGSEKPEWLPRLEKIMSSVRQLAHLMDDVLGENRITLKSSALERQSGDLNAFCEALQVRQMARYKRAIMFEPCAGHVQINADWQLVDVAISNLIDNAIKYSPPDSAIGLRVVRGQGDSVSIEVRDQGEAIPPELQSRIFEKFTRGQVVEDMEGVGLGLYLVNWIAQLHGGRTEVVSNTEGNTFRLTFG
jgi:signal transduction histidine kinase